MRNPRARFFTFIFPVLLLVIFSSVLGHGHTTLVDGAHVSLARFFVGGIIAISIITAAYAGLMVTIASTREAGVLKRRRATPLPPAILIGGQALATLVTAAIASTLLLLVAHIGYGIGFSGRSPGGHGPRRHRRDSELRLPRLRDGGLGGLARLRAAHRADH
ncbi:MAG TPA: ABC transporter permease, partial [Solirubrobacteraceae bacterium]|nr:ABC transporter permease [Solirubrobacteraceae bacterium]